MYPIKSMEFYVYPLDSKILILPDSFSRIFYTYVYNTNMSESYLWFIINHKVIFILKPYLSIYMYTFLIIFKLYIINIHSYIDLSYEHNLTRSFFSPTLIFYSFSILLSVMNFKAFITNFEDILTIQYAETEKFPRKV